ncbi:hypothetical protein [Alsobacter sp. SYSU BS001988]
MVLRRFSVLASAARRSASAKDRSRLLATCALGAILLLPIPAMAAKSTLHGSEMNGYGRAVFNFEELPKATVRVGVGILLVSFDRPVDFSVDKLALELPSYISTVRLDPDGRTLRMALQKPVRPNMMEAGDKLFIDLLPETWRGQPPSLPQDVIEDLSRRARDAEETARRLIRKKASEEVRDVAFRVGTTPTFSRLFFEVPVFAPIDMTKQDNRIELTFQAALRIDANRLRTALPALISAVETEAGPGLLRLALTVQPGVDVRGFREDDNYVLDLAPPKGGKGGKEPGVARDGGKDAPKAAGASPELSPSPDPAGAPRSAAKPAPPAPTPGTPVAVPTPGYRSPTPEPNAGAQIEPAEIKVGVAAERGSVRLTIPLSAATPMAVFERAGSVWIAAETTAPFEPSQVGMVAPGLVSAVDVRRVGRLSILRLALTRAALVRAAASDGRWVVTLGDEVVAQSGIVAFARGSDRDGRSIVRAPFPDVGGVHWVDDPDAGDRLAIVTGRKSVRGVVKGQSFVDFRALPTAMGVVIAPLSDDLAVKAGVDDVTVARDGGLSISALPEMTLAARAGGEGPQLVIDKDVWTRNLSGAVREQRRALERAAAEAPRNARPEARMALAKLELAAGLGQEALGTIAVTMADNPDVANDRGLLILNGIANIVANRIPDAAKTLGAEALSSEPEALLWKAYADAKLRRWPQALAGYRRAAQALASYPDDLQARLAPAFAEAAVEARDFGLAQRLLDMVDGRSAAQPDKDYAALVAGRTAEGVGRVEEALRIYDKLSKEAVRPIEAAARYYAIALSLKDRSIERGAAIAALEVLAMAWRGDDVETRTLGLLGRLYAEDERWREAFTVARQASALYPEAEVTRSLYDEAASRFESLFLDGKAETIPRLDALALYFDFREFTPPGRRGDEIIRRLAERLVALDLLNEATDLLQYQVDSRLNGAAKASVSARLAVLYLMNRQPAKAVKALSESRLAELPQDLKRSRMLLEARALSDLSRTDLAMEMLESEAGPDVNRLRADILWQGRRWREAGEIFERIVGDAWQEPGPLDDRGRADVMRAAIAYGLGDENLSLERLRAKYSTKMADSVDAKAFMVVTSPQTARPAEYRDLARSIATADTLGEFLTEYRKRYPDTPALPPRAKRKPEPAPGGPAAGAPPQAENAAPNTAEPKKADADPKKDDAANAGGKA